MIFGIHRILRRCEEIIGLVFRGLRRCGSKIIPTSRGLAETYDRSKES